LADEEKSRMPLPPGYHAAGDNDRREEFERLACIEGDAASERAFLANKIELIRSDGRLTAAEKDAAVAALQSRLDALADNTV
jgi:hypothetical protein